MNLVDVAAELAAQLGTILAGRTTPYAPDTGQPPFGFVVPPEIGFDVSYARGLDTLRLSVYVAVARQPIDVAWTTLAPFLSGSGDSSVKQVLEAGEYDSLDTIQVTGARGVDIALAGGTYKGAEFDLVITGSGT
jgi:hypothetical protein